MWTKEHQKNVTFDNFLAVFKLNLPPEDYITEKINVQTLEVIFIEFLKTWLSLLSKNLSKIKQNFCKFEGLQPQKMFDSIVYYNEMVYIRWTLNNTPPLCWFVKRLEAQGWKPKKLVFHMLEMQFCAKKY